MELARAEGYGLDPAACWAGEAEQLWASQQRSLQPAAAAAALCLICKSLCKPFITLKYGRAITWSPATKQWSFPGWTPFFMTPPRDLWDQVCYWRGVLSTLQSPEGSKAGVRHSSAAPGTWGMGTDIPGLQRCSGKSRNEKNTMQQQLLDGHISGRIWGWLTELCFYPHLEAPRESQRFRDSCCSKRLCAASRWSLLAEILTQLPELLSTCWGLFFRRCCSHFAEGRQYAEKLKGLSAIRWEDEADCPKPGGLIIPVSFLGGSQWWQCPKSKHQNVGLDKAF